MSQRNYDISRVHEGGYLVLPLSMCRLANGHNPATIYEFLQFFEQKIPRISVDVILLYTDGLYMNSDQAALSLRKKTVNQVVQHKSELLNLILKERRYVPQAFHFLPWDYAVFNSAGLQETRNALLTAYKGNRELQQAIAEDLKTAGREGTEANISFLMEELVVTHLIQQKQVALPRTLASESGWRLICYPGDPLQSLIVVHRTKCLPKNASITDGHQLYARSFYNMDERVLIDFERTCQADAPTLSSFSTTSYYS